MEVTIIKEDSKIKALLKGRIDTTTAGKFQQDIEELFNAEKPDIELDCTDLEYTSSQGLRIFMLLQKSVSSKAGKMVMTSMRPQVKEVFDITGFSNVIKII